MLLGYARVSASDQNPDLQQDALQAAGCARVYTDVVSGVKAECPQLQEALDYAREGDTLIAWRLDRLGRSLSDLLSIVGQLAQRGTGLQSLTEKLDTTSSQGRPVFHLFGSLAGFERNLIRERTQAGLQAARARGRKGGRPADAAESDGRLETALRLLDRELAGIARNLQEDNADLEALQKLEDHTEMFTAGELEELRALFGLYGLEMAQRLAAGPAEVAYVETRARAWRLAAEQARQPDRSAVAARAETRYELMLDTLLASERGSAA